MKCLRNANYLERYVCPDNDTFVMMERANYHRCSGFNIAEPGDGEVYGKRVAASAENSMSYLCCETQWTWRGILFETTGCRESVWNHRVIKKKKSKAVPLQAWSGPDGSRKLRFPVLMTTAQDGGKVVSLTHRPPLPPGNAPGTHFC